jgi:asparagine synthase (glutamine-hydrolysing)
MCGIIGVFNRKDSLSLVKTGLKSIEYRGRDSSGFCSAENYSVGHCLHSVVGRVKQPIVRKGVLVSNCEIYNWKELNEKYMLDAGNDSELLSLLLEQKKVEDAVKEIDGIYAFAYIIDNKLLIARDIIGVKPVWFSHSDGFAFASEKKALEKIGFRNIIELNPRKIIKYDIKNNKLLSIERPFFEIAPETKESRKKIIDRTKKLLIEAVKKQVPDRKFGLLFSGGVDSSVLALLLKKFGKFTCYVAVLDNPNRNEPEDLVYSKRAAELLGLDLKVVKIKEEDVLGYLKIIVPLIEDSNVIKVGVALTFFAACEQAKKDGCKVIFSGLGSEEIFAGYQRHRQSSDINRECLSGLLKMYERDLYRDDVITMFHLLELRVPFLDKKLVEYSLKIPAKYKIRNETTKFILRETALKLGLDRKIALRKKRAAQYGSNFHKALKKLARKNRTLISEYLLQFYPAHNLKLGALVSGGKDSIYAMHVMMRQNYKVECMITLRSRNPDSFMFHTPAIDLVKLQAKSIGIPLVEQDTEGEKEKELDDLKHALEKARQKYQIEGIATGALFSNYQRDRIEKVADSLGLKIFAPLWHMDQETEMRQIIDSGFSFIITKVACEGLDKSWLGKPVTHKDIDKLVELNQRIGINIAFEGGEAETLMIDGPIFKKKIQIKDYEIKEESPAVAELKIKKAELSPFLI